MSSDIVLQLAIAGASIGSIYALVAIGLVLVFKSSGILNFAQGEFVTLGAYLGLFAVVLWQFEYWSAVAAAVLGAAVVGLAMERSVIRPLLSAPPFTVVIATLAVGLAIRNLLRLTWQEANAVIPDVSSQEPMMFWSARINPQYLWTIGASFLLMGLLALFFRFTSLGIAMRAVAENQRAAQFAGINVGRMLMLLFAVSGGIAGLAGILLAPLTGVHTELGWIVVKGLIAAVLGGFGSLWGAFLGGMVLGLVEVFAGALLGGAARDLAVFSCLFLMLMLRPYGLMGRAEVRRV